MLDREIAVQLRARGHDVESIQGDHEWLQATYDTVVLEEAGGMGRSLVTDNVGHFLVAHERIVAAGKHHAGLVLASPRGYPLNKRTIGLWVQALAVMLDKYRDRPTADLVEWLPESFSDRPFLQRSTSKHPARL